ncbi:MAG: DUF2484 family protein [Paracoccaceae bacterium]
MASSLILACSLWVIVGAATAFLPLLRQMIPGLVLILTAPALLVWIGLLYGWVWVVVGVLAFGSMFRSPIRYFYRRARGLPVDLPPEFRR